MPIDTTVWARDQKAIIVDLPVNIRFKWSRVVYLCSFSSQDFGLDLMDGGIPFNKSAKVVLALADIKGRLPQQNDLVQIQMKNLSWATYEVKGLSDVTDPQAVALTMVIGNPDK